MNSIFLSQVITGSFQLKEFVKNLGWGDGLVGKGTCYINMRTWVQIPNTHVISQAWPHEFLTPPLGSSSRAEWGGLPGLAKNWRAPGSVRSCLKGIGQKVIERITQCPLASVCMSWVHMHVQTQLSHTHMNKKKSSLSLSKAAQNQPMEHT